MPITVDATPNPNALKFTVGQPVGGPATHTADGGSDDPTVAALLAIEGVVSIFMTADFVTLSKDAAADWSAIRPEAERILSERYD